jgi:GNAT superfamily N-acetyltransferase
MKHITFRTALLTDLPAIINLLADDPLGNQRETISHPPDERYIAAFNAIEADPNQQLIVAIDNNSTNHPPIGTLQLSFIPGIARHGAWRGQIEAVRIAATHRSTGIGQHMFEWAIAECRLRGCTIVQLTTDKTRPEAHRFYEKLGFVASHEGYKIILQPRMNY